MRLSASTHAKWSLGIRIRARGKGCATVEQACSVLTPFAGRQPSCSSSCWALACIMQARATQLLDRSLSKWSHKGFAALEAANPDPPASGPCCDCALPVAMHAGMAWEDLPWDERIMALTELSTAERATVCNHVFTLPEEVREAVVPAVREVAVLFFKEWLAAERRYKFKAQHLLTMS